MYTQSRTVTCLFKTIDLLAKALGFQDHDSFAEKMLELNMGDQGVLAPLTLGVRSAVGALGKPAPREW